MRMLSHITVGIAPSRKTTTSQGLKKRARGALTSKVGCLIISMKKQRKKRKRIHLKLSPWSSVQPQYWGDKLDHSSPKSLNPTSFQIWRERRYRLAPVKWVARRKISGVMMGCKLLEWWILWETRLRNVKRKGMARFSLVAIPPRQDIGPFPFNPKMTLMYSKG